jgi:hypothetical protein
VKRLLLGDFPSSSPLSLSLSKKEIFRPFRPMHKNRLVTVAAALPISPHPWAPFPPTFSQEVGCLSMSPLLLAPAALRARPKGTSRPRLVSTPTSSLLLAYARSFQIPYCFLHSYSQQQQRHERNLKRSRPMPCGHRQQSKGTQHDLCMIQRCLVSGLTVLNFLFGGCLTMALCLMHDLLIVEAEIAKVKIG